MNTAEWEEPLVSALRSVWVNTDVPHDGNYARTASDWPLARTTGDVRKDASRARRLCPRPGRFVVSPLSCRGAVYSFLKACPPHDESMRKIWTPTKRNIHVIGRAEHDCHGAVARDARPGGLPGRPRRAPRCQPEFHGQLAAAGSALRYLPEFGRDGIVLPATVITRL